MTAFQGSHSYDQNVRRNQDLASKIRAAGYGYFFVGGSYVMADGQKIVEDSIFIPGKDNDNGNLKGLLKKWCRDYGQESALYKPEKTTEGFLLYPNGDMTSIGSFHPNIVSDFMTRLNGRPGSFVFESAAVQMNWFEAFAKTRFGRQPAIRP
jgi:hypothetical protein